MRRSTLIVIMILICLLAATAAASRLTQQQRLAQVQREIQAEGLGWTAHINPVFSDVSAEEKFGFIDSASFRQFMEALRKNPAPVYVPATLPLSVNWEDSGKVSPVKQQIGNTCWAYASTAALESMYLIKYDSLLDLSEQQLVSCASFGLGCDGDMINTALDYWLYTRGAISEESMPMWYYCDGGRPCVDQQYPIVADLLGWGGVGGEDAIKAALLNGPVVISMTPYNDMGFYDTGCYEPTASSVPSIYLHACVIVGYNDTLCNGTGAWRLKQSWGTLFADDGFMWIKYGTCGINYGAALFVDGESRWVDPVAGNDTTGTGSQTAPFRSIRACLGAAHGGDTIRLAGNIYTGEDNTELLTGGLTVMPADDSAHPVIDCEGTRQAFTFHDRETNRTKLIGLTIMNATDQYSFFHGGGAIHIENASPVIENCTFVNCISRSGGGGAVWIFESGTDTRPVLKNCTFENNRVLYRIGYLGYGGAVGVQKARPVIDSCVFRNNWVQQNTLGMGGAIAVLNPAGSCEPITIEITNCLFDGNRAGDSTIAGSGGAVYKDECSNLTVSGCTFVNNGAINGAAVFIRTGDANTVTFERNIVASNRWGAAVSVPSTSQSQIGCNLFYSNSSDFGGGVSCQNIDSANLFMDPRFCNPDSSNYSILAQSPCSQAHSPCGELIGAFGVGCDDSIPPAPVPWYPLDSSYANGLVTFFYGSSGMPPEEIWFDDDPSFCSPDLIISDASSGMTLYPEDFPSTQPWWHWRVRGLVDSVWTAWSWSQSFHFGPAPSCPVLFVHDGKEYVKENPLLTACEASDYKDIVTDYYRIYSRPGLSDGSVKIQLRELEDEITYLDGLDLIAVDHPEFTRVACDNQGRFVTYRKSVAPVRAADNRGVDHLSEISAQDGVLFAADAAGCLVLTFPSQTGNDYGFIINPTTKMPCWEEYKAAPGRSPRSRNPLTVEQLRSDGTWLQLPPLPTRESVPSDPLFVRPDASASGDSIVIRLCWDDTYTTDAILQMVPESELPLVQVAGLVRAEAVGGKLAAQWRGFNASGRLVMNRGDVLDMNFAESQPIGPGLVRDYFVKAVGRYEPASYANRDVVPATFALHNNYPNPFNPSTIIDYSLPAASHVKLEVFNVLGQRVAILEDGNKPAGNYSTEFDASGYPSGIYFYRLTYDGGVATRKMVLLK